MYHRPYHEPAPVQPTDEAAVRHEKRQTLAQRTDAELADELEYTLVNSFRLLQHRHGTPVSYEDALVQLYLPEVLRRLRGVEEVPHSYAVLRGRMDEAAQTRKRGTGP